MYRYIVQNRLIFILLLDTLLFSKFATTSSNSAWIWSRIPIKVAVSFGVKRCPYTRKLLKSSVLKSIMLKQMPRSRTRNLVFRERACIKSGLLLAMNYSRKGRLPITTTNTKIQLTDVTSPLFIILRVVELELLIDSLFLTLNLKKAIISPYNNKPLFLLIIINHYGNI